MIVFNFRNNLRINIFVLKPQADSLLFAAGLLLVQPIQIEEVDLVFQIGGLKMCFGSLLHLL